MDSFRADRERRQRARESRFAAQRDVEQGASLVPPEGKLTMQKMFLTSLPR